jgi:hypothetical protein
MGLSLATVKRRLTKAEAVLATAQRLDEREHGGGA